MEQQFTYLDIPVDVNLDLICKYHEASSVYLDTSYTVKKERFVKRGVRICIRHDIPSDSGEFEIHPDYDIEAIAEKYLPDFKHTNQLLALTSNMIELDWGLVYGQHLIHNGADSLSLISHANLALIEIQKLMMLRENKTNVNLTFNAFKDNENIAEPSKGGRGGNKKFIDRSRQLIIKSSEEIDFVLNHLINFKIQSLTLNPFMNDLIQQEGIKKFELDEIHYLIEATSVPFKEARAFYLFRELLAKTLAKLVSEQTEPSTSNLKRYSLIYSIFLLFSLIEPSVHKRHNSDRAKEKYIGSMVTRHTKLLNKIQALEKQISREMNELKRNEFINELAELKSGIFPFITINDIKLTM